MFQSEEFLSGFNVPVLNATDYKNAQINMQMSQQTYVALLLFNTRHRYIDMCVFVLLTRPEIFVRELA